MAEKYDPETINNNNLDSLTDDISESKESTSDSAEIERDKVSESSSNSAEQSSVPLQEHYSEAVCECVCPCETCEEMRSFPEGEDLMHLCVCAEECSEEYFVPDELQCTCGNDQNPKEAMHTLHCCSCGVQLSTMERCPKEPRKQPSTDNNHNHQRTCSPNRQGPSPPPPPPLPNFPIVADFHRIAAAPPSYNLLRVISCDDGGSSDTRLHEAARSGRAEDLEVLLGDPQLQKNINSRVKPFMSTPLREAVVGGSCACVKLLLKNGAEVDAVDVKGQTALFLATSLEQAGIMELLLCAGADPEGSRYNNSTPLLVCVRDGSLAALQALLRHSVDPEPLPLLMTCVPGWPLQHSIVYQHFDCFLALLKGGAEPCLEVLCRRGKQSEGGIDRGILQRLSITRTILRHASESPEYILTYREFGGRLESPTELPQELFLHPSPAAQALAAVTEEPQSLLSLCRVALRRAVGAPRLPLLAEIAELPECLQQFLAYEDMDKYCHKPQ